jgi:hypothetical protein
MNWRPGWTQVTIALAVIAALAIASPVFGGSKGTKKAIKKEVARQIGNARGPVGPAGAPGASGADATKLFAFILDNGSAATAEVAYGSGVTAVSDPAGNNAYTVTFNRSLANCVVQAVAGVGDPQPSAATVFNAIPLVNMHDGGPDQVSVGFINTASAATDTAFLIAAFC